MAYNRLEFTQQSFGWLERNTDWSQVDRLVVYDDHSQLRSRLWLQDACAEFDKVPVDFRVHPRRLGSPVAIMADYLEHPADWFVKLDNDVAVPEGWLNALLQVVADDQTIDLLGFEAGMTIAPYEWPGVVSAQDWDGRYGFRESTHIGGVGLMRSAVFAARKLIPLGRFYGFTEWQHTVKTVKRGWITPDLQSPLLDRMPMEPYLSLSKSYREAAWQRDWGVYDCMEWAYAWLLERQEEVA